MRRAPIRPGRPASRTSGGAEPIPGASATSDADRLIPVGGAGRSARHRARLG